MSDYFDATDSVREHDLLRKEHAQLGYSRPRVVDIYLASAAFALIVSAIIFSLVVI